MPKLHLDFETRSTVDLRKTGVDVYAEHPTTGVICLAYAVDDEPVQLLDVTAVSKPEGPLLAALANPDTIYFAHNAHFELVMWHHVMHKRHGWPNLDPAKMRCTMAMAYALGLPGSLDDAAASMHLGVTKDKEGRALMMRMCRPRAVDAKGRVTWWQDEDRLQRLYDYCRTDVEVERTLERALRPLKPSEQALWTRDYFINRRGVQLDVHAIRLAQAATNEAARDLNAELSQLTDGVVPTATNVGKLSAWVRAQGHEVHSLTKGDVSELMASGLPPHVKRALEIRQQVGKASTKKLDAMLHSASPDSRARGLLQFHGAGTGRWSGRRVQPQNLPRPKLKQDEIEKVIASLDRPDFIERVKLTHGEPMEVLASCLRGMIVAAPGHDLITVDFANIEGRVLAWLAEQDSKVDAYRAYDAGTGPDLYKVAAADIYKKPIEEITSDERQIGKVAELALGYQGGRGAFATMAAAYGVEVDEARAEEIKTAWRKANPDIVNFWYALERAAFAAVKKPGTVQEVGRIKFRVSGRWLFCCLPSGRVLAYAYPRIEARKVPWQDELVNGVRFYAYTTMGNSWGPVDAYGGLWAENVTQAVARDLLAGAIIRADDAGYPVILHVHDEVVSEVPESFGSLEEFTAIIVAGESWSEGLPIAGEGWRGKRYRKG